MKKIRLLILCSLVAICDESFSKPIITDITTVNKKGEAGFIAYKDFEFIQTPVGLIDGEWRLHSGVIETFTRKSEWIPFCKAPDGFKSSVLYNRWGSVGLGQSKFTISPLTRAESFEAMQCVDDKIIEVGRDWVNESPGQGYSVYTVYERHIGDNSQQKASSFELNDEILNIRIGSIIPVSNKLIIMVAGSQINGISFLIFYDLIKNQPVGFTSFSRFQYLPYGDSLWIAPNLHGGGLSSVELEKALSDAKNAAKTFPILINGTLNPAFCQKSDFILNINKVRKK